MRWNVYVDKMEVAWWCLQETRIENMHWLKWIKNHTDLCQINNDNSLSITWQQHVLNTILAHYNWGNGRGGEGGGGGCRCCKWKTYFSQQLCCLHTDIQRGHKEIKCCALWILLNLDVVKSRVISNNTTPNKTGSSSCNIFPLQHINMFCFLSDN